MDSNSAKFAEIKRIISQLPESKLETALNMISSVRDYNALMKFADYLDSQISRDSTSFFDSFNSQITRMTEIVEVSLSSLNFKGNKFPKLGEDKNHSLRYLISQNDSLRKKPIELNMLVRDIVKLIEKLLESESA